MVAILHLDFRSNAIILWFPAQDNHFVTITIILMCSQKHSVIYERKPKKNSSGYVITFYAKFRNSPGFEL